MWIIWAVALSYFVSGLIFSEENPQQQQHQHLMVPFSNKTLSLFSWKISMTSQDAYKLFSKMASLSCANTLQKETEWDRERQTSETNVINQVQVLSGTSINRFLSVFLLLTASFGRRRKKQEQGSSSFSISCLINMPFGYAHLCWLIFRSDENTVQPVV